ncbi:MAG: flavodoxin family protein, partial [Candidatus Moranbacteria bacterium]|nr:flavodoxin family protein [Candidatus Moranbacteria bacterium]
MKRILIINGHPDKVSLNNELAIAYKRGAEASGAKCILINLVDLEFDPILRYGYRQRTELEPVLVEAQKEILNAEHLVFVYPTWWGTYPALLKGFVERVFLPKFAFKYRENSLLWDKLLKGKTARLIVTMDTPKWYYSLVFKKMKGNISSTNLRKLLVNVCQIRVQNNNT